MGERVETVSGAGVGAKRVRRVGAAYVMTLLALLACALGRPDAASAQWTTPDASNNINNTNSGNVGVGTPAPSNPLTVISNTNVTPLKVAGTHPIVIGYLVQNLRPGSKGWAFQVAGDQHPDGVTNGSFIFRQATDDINAMVINAAGNVGIGTLIPAAGYKFDVNGAAHVSGDMAVDGNISAKFQDVAEWVPSTQKLAAGTVVVLDVERTNHVLASATVYDTKVAGVVSAQPGVILGVAGEGKVMVATTGRVKVKVDATRGAIKVGDLLVTGGVEGVAMKSVPVDLGGTQIHRPGTIIGKALEPLESGVGEILVLLSLQ